MGYHKVCDPDVVVLDTCHVIKCQDRMLLLCTENSTRTTSNVQQVFTRDSCFCRSTINVIDGVLGKSVSADGPG